MSIHYLTPHLLGPLGLDVGEVGVPCYVSMATTPAPPQSSERKTAFAPTSRKILGLAENLPLGILILMHSHGVHKHHPP